jgi:hypothetical protein
MLVASIASCPFNRLTKCIFLALYLFKDVLAKEHM